MAAYKILVVALACWLLTVACSEKPPAVDGHPSEQTYAAELRPEVTEFTELLSSLIPRLLDGYGTPGASIALVEDGRLVWSGAYGSADQNGRRGMSSETVFALNDLSKPVTAWGVMRLVEEGKIGLDDPVDIYLERWHVQASAYDSRTVTVRRLLSHTAGISTSASNPRADSLESSLGGPAPYGPPAVQVRSPGQFLYSDHNYTILQMLIEDITGREFADYMQETILRPLGMDGASFEVNSRTASAAATGGDANITSQDARLNVRTNPVQAPLGLSGTAVDMARWLAAHTPGEGGEPAGRGVLTPASVLSLIAPVASTDRRPEDVSWLALASKVSAYTLGFRLEELESDQSLIEHASQRPGWMSVAAMLPDFRSGIVVLTNSSTSGPSLIQHSLCMWLEWRATQASSECGSLYDIYAVKVDGSGLTPVATNAASELVPVWSPDGRRIAFHTAAGHETTHSFVIAMDGSGQKRLTRDDKRDSWPDWSPDGTRFAYTSLRDGRDAIFASLLDGSKVTLVAQDQSKQVSQPRWSPDGTKIAYFKVQQGPAPIFELWIMTADGNEQRKLANAGPGIIDWSPDGKFISFEESGQIVLFSLADNLLRKITNDQGSSRGASFSPDSRRLVYATGPEGDADLYLINIDGSDRQKLIAERADEIMPAWSPDGSTIVFSTNRSQR